MVIIIGLDVSVGKGKSYDTGSQNVKMLSFSKIDPHNFNSLKSLIREIKRHDLSKIAHVSIAGSSTDREEDFLEEAMDSLSPAISYSIDNTFETEYLYLYGLLSQRLQENENMTVIKVADSDVSAEMFKMVQNKLVLFRYYFVQTHTSVDLETVEKLMSLVNSERYCKNFVVQHLSFWQKGLFKKAIKNARVSFTKPVDASRSAMLFAMMKAGIAAPITIDMCSGKAVEGLPDAAENGNIVIPKTIKPTNNFLVSNTFQEYIKRYDMAKNGSQSCLAFLSPRRYIEKLTSQRYVTFERKKLQRTRSESC